MIGVAGAATVAAQSPGQLRVKVVDEESRLPLPNAELIEQASGQHRFTNERGDAALKWPEGGQVQLRVRQIGYQFVERSLTRAADAAADTATVALHRVTYVLPQVFSNTRCGSDTDPASKLLAASVLEQLRAGAERYREFRVAYPFHITQEKRTWTIGVGGKPQNLRRLNGEADSEEWGDPYVPGDVVQHDSHGFSAPILFISALADPVFWNRHCFVARGVQTLAGARVVRLEFTPNTDLRNADWEGAALVDSATSVLRRVEFRLTGLVPGDEPTRLEGYTMFASPSPLIAVPDSTVAVWWRRNVTNGQWGSPDAVLTAVVRQLSYRKDVPPGARK